MKVKDPDVGDLDSRSMEAIEATAFDSLRPVTPPCQLASYPQNHREHTNTPDIRGSHVNKAPSRCGS